MPVTRQTPSVERGVVEPLNGRGHPFDFTKRLYFTIDCDWVPGRRKGSKRCWIAATAITLQEPSSSPAVLSRPILISYGVVMNEATSWEPMAGPMAAWRRTRISERPERQQPDSICRGQRAVEQAAESGRCFSCVESLDQRNDTARS